MAVNSLQMECTKCKVASTCPRKGASPIVVRGSGTRKVHCYIVGGYGRTPVERRILSETSKQIADRDGPCLTIAYVPVIDELTDELQFEITKIFSPPVLHEREKVGFHMGMLYPKSGGDR